MSYCGARNFLFAEAHKISTAATPFASLSLPLAALGNVPTSIPLRIYVYAQKSSTFNIKFSRLRLVMSCCGARNFLFAEAHKISTAATPFASLSLPLAALGNVPTSIPLRIYVYAQKSSTFNIKFSRLRLVMSCCGARNFQFAQGSQNFDRCHSFCFAFSATSNAQQRPHLDMPPNTIR